MALQDKARIVQRLIAETKDLPPRLQLAAKYIVDHSHAFGMDPIRETAGKIGIGANSLVRLADHLGFDSFDALRAPFRAALTARYDASEGQGWIDRVSGAGGFGSEHALSLRNEMEITGQSLRHFTADQAQQAVEMLTGAQNAYVTATRASYSLAYYFHYVGRMALPGLQLIPRHMGSPVDEMMNVGPGDVLLAITFAPYSAETIRALRLAKDNGAQVILISDSELIAPNITADLFLKAAAQSQHFFPCFSGAMVVLEGLLHHLIRQGGDDVRNRIARYEELREDSGAYWQAKLPKVRR